MAKAEQVARDGSTNEDSGPAPLHRRRLSARGFVKLMAGAVVGIAAVQLTGARRAQATYYPGSPSDVVDTDLTIQGNLIVNQNVGVGTATPQGKLDVAGGVRNGTVVVLDSAGRSTRSYYSGGEAQAIEETMPVGAWGRLRERTWGSLIGPPATTWAAVQLSAGTWGDVAEHAWGECLSNNWSWDDLKTLE